MTVPLSIELEDLGKIYPRKIGAHLVSATMRVLRHSNEEVPGGVALAGLTLSIRRGERIGLIGRNGAGKSTLLQMLAGITEPTSGQIKISGKVTAILTLGVGLREDLSGRENIYLDGEAQGKSRKEMQDDVDAIIEFAELGKFIDLPLHTYSTGMKARLAFAIITQIDPEILIIDEALSVGDSAFSIKASRRISQLCACGAIVIIVSHSMSSIRELCNRCLWLDKGKLIMDGSPEAVTRAYIESIEVTEEGDNIERFRSLAGVQSFIPNFSLGELKLTSNGSTIYRLKSGAELKLNCDCQMPEEECLGQFFLRCIRLDGALICEHALALPEIPILRELQMIFPRFNLAPGLYRLQLSWSRSDGIQRAESSNIVEVFSEDTTTGGRPVLLGVGRTESLSTSEER